jgi:hypothetical protein
MKQIFIFLFCTTVFGQKLHHQMLSSMGASKIMSSGLTVKQTIGQQSVSGNFSNGAIKVGQGFQQSSISKSIPSSTPEIMTVVYPLPFTDKLNFQFSVPITGTINIVIFDVAGRLIYNENKEAVDTILTLNELYFAEGEYFVKLTAKNYKFSTTILRTK